METGQVKIKNKLDFQLFVFVLIGNSIGRHDVDIDIVTGIL